MKTHHFFPPEATERGLGTDPCPEDENKFSFTLNKYCKAEENTLKIGGKHADLVHFREAIGINCIGLIKTLGFAKAAIKHT